jgi:hypothetical protein
MLQFMNTATNLFIFQQIYLFSNEFIYFPINLFIFQQIYLFFNKFIYLSTKNKVFFRTLFPILECNNNGFFSVFNKI